MSNQSAEEETITVGLNSSAASTTVTANKSAQIALPKSGDAEAVVTFVILDGSTSLSDYTLNADGTVTDATVTQDVSSTGSRTIGVIVDTCDSVVGNLSGTVSQDGTISIVATGS